MNPIDADAILIDFYGTIAAGDRLAVERTCRKVVETFGLDTTPDLFAQLWGERYFATVRASNHEAFRTLHECEILSLRETLADMPVHPLHDGQGARLDRLRRDPRPLLAELEAYWTDPPLHADAVRFLQTVNKPTCCVSNADTRPLMAAIARHGLKFDAVISSESVRCYKPETHIFEQALGRLGVRADRAVHIGDSLHSDIAGARRAGVRSVWICREDRIHDIGTEVPDLKLSSFTDISPN